MTRTDRSVLAAEGRCCLAMLASRFEESLLRADLGAADYRRAMYDGAAYALNELGLITYAEYSDRTADLFVQAMAARFGEMCRKEAC